MKRVFCLYRVSTKKQVDHNELYQSDIPMQKQACHEFAERQGDWTIMKEFSEHGISGYKVSAQDRDAIHDLQMAAERREFDVLLVFMFDRIGRIDDETPFVVEWFVKHGIEVWSTQEGQQRFDSHVDKLMNYIRFWQASGESEKTSMRIHSKMQQMLMEGLYTGGPIRFGYRLVDSGRVNRKNIPIRKYEIDPEEREIVEMIDEMSLHEGYGSYRMADYLNKHGYAPKNGGKFTSIKVIRILSDPYYCGRLADGSTSPALQALQIRSEDTYKQIQYLLEQRGTVSEEKRHMAMRTNGQAMLLGNLFCAHCGGRLNTIHYQNSYTRADGTEYQDDAIKYCCANKVHKICKCEGQTTYQAERVDALVTETIYRLFANLSGAPEEENLRKAYHRQVSANHATQRRLSKELEKDSQNLEKLQLEISKTLTGDSVYTPQDLSDAIATIRKRMEEKREHLAELQESEQQEKKGMERIVPAYRQFKSWAEEFDQATMEQKKMIACNLFKRIEVSRDYHITVEVNMTYQQFCEEWDAEAEAEEAAI